jgi:hypothetical protein
VIYEKFNLFASFRIPTNSPWNDGDYDAWDKLCEDIHNVFEEALKQFDGILDCVEVE